jgi:bacteriocin-like protein
MADQNTKDKTQDEQKKKDSAKPLDSKELDQVSGGTSVGVNNTHGGINSTHGGNP